MATEFQIILYGLLGLVILLVVSKTRERFDVSKYPEPKCADGKAPSEMTGQCPDGTNGCPSGADRFAIFSLRKMVCLSSNSPDTYSINPRISNDPAVMKRTLETACKPGELVAEGLNKKFKCIRDQKTTPDASTSAANPVPETPALSALSSSEFDRVLAQFKSSILEYKVTGQTIFKQRADVAEKWLNDYINTLNGRIQRDATFIDNFTKSYAKTNPELVKYKNEIAQAREKGPGLQDTYEGEKETQEQVPVDETPYYTKAAVVGGILALAAVVSFL